MERSQIAQYSTNRNSSASVLFPFLWSLVANEILKTLKGTYGIFYADDINILVTGKFLDIISNVIDNALKIIHVGRYRLI